MSKKVLVTGASGFTGGHLCRRLVREGFSVRALLRDSSLEQATRDQGVEPIVGDVRDSGSLERALHNVDIVYHLAAAFRAGGASARELHATNVIGTRNLVEKAILANVDRFVHCSSVGVHGNIEDPPADEAAPMSPDDAYQTSKVEGEIVARETAAKAGLPLVIFRPAGIYGPGDTRFLKLVKALQRPVFPMIGNGRVLYQMIYISDLIDGILACGTRNEAVGNTYILTGHDAVTLNELVGIVADALSERPFTIHVPIAPVYLLSAIVEYACAPLGIEPPLFRRRLDFFRKTRSFDIGKARRELAFAPCTTLEAGFRKTVEWYRQEGLIW